MTRDNWYDTSGRRSPRWKLKATAGALALVGGVTGGIALTSHPSQHATIRDSAFQFGFGQHGNGAMLNSAVTSLSQHGLSAFSRTRSFQELGALQGFGSQFSLWQHHQFSQVAFERGQVVLITHHFLIVRGLDGKLTVWRLSGDTAVKDVATTATTPTAIVAMAAVTGWEWTSLAAAHEVPALVKST